MILERLFQKKRLCRMFTLGIRVPMVGQLPSQGRLEHFPIRQTQEMAGNSLVSLKGHAEGAGNRITFSIKNHGQTLDIRASGPKASAFPANLIPGVVWPLLSGRVASRESGYSRITPNHVVPSF